MVTAVTHPVQMVDQHLEMTSTALNVIGDHDNYSRCAPAKTSSPRWRTCPSWTPRFRTCLSQNPSQRICPSYSQLQLFCPSQSQSLQPFQSWSWFSPLLPPKILYWGDKLCLCQGHKSCFPSILCWFHPGPCPFLLCWFCSASVTPWFHSGPWPFLFQQLHQNLYRLLLILLLLFSLPMPPASLALPRSSGPPWPSWPFWVTAQA